jgi:pimeloyl-ACP methyl ester carboxylesterase
VGGRARELFLAMNGIALANDAGDRESEVDAYARLEELRCPVTVAWGDLDVPFVLDRCAEVAARVPAARTHVFAGMAHLPYLERSDEVADVVHGAIAQAATP